MVELFRKSLNFYSSNALFLLCTYVPYVDSSAYPFVSVRTNRNCTSRISAGFQGIVPGDIMATTVHNFFAKNLVKGIY